MSSGCKPTFDRMSSGARAVRHTVVAIAAAAAGRMHSFHPSFAAVAVAGGGQQVAGNLARHRLLPRCRAADNIR